MSGNDGETLLHYNANYNETIQVVMNINVLYIQVVMKIMYYISPHYL